MRTPGHRLLAALVYCLAAGLAAIWIATAQPWLGLGLHGGPDGRVTAQTCRTPCAGIPSGAVIAGLQAPGAGALAEITAVDLTEEPDVLPDAAALRQFLEDQGRLAALLGAPAVSVLWHGTAGAAPHQTRIEPATRPWTSLPAIFWFQWLAAATGCLIAIWVWALRPGDAATRLFALTGLTFPLFALPAAIYGTRELALDPGLFRVLTSLNCLGALTYGAAFAAIFLAHPRRLAKPAVLLAFPLAAVLWWLLSAVGLLTDPDWVIRLPTLSLMLAALAFALIQWRLSRFQAADRAALRWFLLSLLLGAGLYIASHVVSSILGWLPPIPQGYAFGFFLIIYLGIALGLRRYRLFDLDAWAYRLLVSMGVLLAILLADAAMITLLGWSAQTSLGLSIWGVGLLYLLVRQRLWKLLDRPRDDDLVRVLPLLVEVAFEPGPQKREHGWQQLLRTHYDPLRIEILPDSAGTLDSRAAVEQDGAALYVPAGTRRPDLRLLHRNQGTRLFSSRDARFATSMIRLLERAETSRDAFEDAIRQERGRIAQDLHDDVGARLLMLIHRAPQQETADLARQAMSDLRDALSVIDAEPSRLSESLADWRSEAQSRCHAAGAGLIWRVPATVTDPLIQPRQKMLLTRALRECLNNCFKHAHHDGLQIELCGMLSETGLFTLDCTDNGEAADPGQWIKGRGLRGLERRLHDLGGTVEFHRLPQGSRVRMQMALALPPGRQAGASPRRNDHGTLPAGR